MGIWISGWTYVTDGDVLLTGLLQKLGDNTLLLELKVHLGLVGLDLDQDITRGDAVTGLLLPRSDISRRHGGRQSGHLDDGVRGVGGVTSQDLGREVGAEEGVLTNSPSQD